VFSEFATHGLHHFLALLADPGPGGGGGDVVPDPAPALPPGLGPDAGKLVAWAKGGALVVGVLSFILCGGMMMAGRRNRGQVGVEGAVGGGWVIGGLALVGAAAVLVRSFAL
jgi:hypothetical protein